MTSIFVQRENETSSRTDWLLAIALFGITLLSRLTNCGALYFVDGPRLARSITRHTYVIQPPGYWVFAHLGGLFHDPAAGLAFWNMLFSAVGVGVFYLLCREVRHERVLCFLAALAFSSVYFIWFAGEIHSSYASQILFPPLSLYCFLRYIKTQSSWWSLGWATSSAFGMALRPSDGVFLLPLALYLLYRYVSDRRTWIQYWVVMLVGFAAWYIPTRVALTATHRASTAQTLLIQMRMVSPLLTGLNARSLANMSRVILPLAIAFWPLLPAVLTRRNALDNKLAFFWAAPGLLFFFLCYIADPTYLIFLAGACFWLVVTSRGTRRAIACLVLCTLFNTTLFLAARPTRGSGVVAQIYDFYVVKYCRYGIQRQWSSTLGRGAAVPND